MARSRNIKPGFFTNDVLGELPALTRLLFAGLWTICDREGRLEDRPKKIRAEVLPYDQCDADEMLTALDKAGFIKRYEADGKCVIQVLAWSLHQNPHMKEAPSTLPVYVEHQTSTIQTPDSAQPLPERAGLIPSLLIPDSLNLVVVTKDKTRAIAPPDGVSDVLWQDFKKLRNQKKAPITSTALDGIRREAAKAGVTLPEALKTCCERGWAGFKAEWMAERVQGFAPVQTVTVPSKPGIDPTLSHLIAEKLSGSVKPPSADMRAELARLSGRRVSASLQ